MIAWPEGVNKYVLRESTWELPEGFLQDETRSGKRKRRYAHSQKPEVYKCVLHMSKEEYYRFKDWYNIACRRGTMSFPLPRIDGGKDANEVEYQFTKESIKVSNPGGDVIKLSFSLEEVLY